MSYSNVQQRQILTLARESISHGLMSGRTLAVDSRDYDLFLRELACSFVTLRKLGELRGCIGSLSPRLPLVEDIVTHAFSAAFEDSRFPRVAPDELSLLDIEVSILSPQQEISFRTEEELLDQLRPFKDGLTLEDGHHHSTFLPSVWDIIPDKKTFLIKLKQKAGMKSSHWSKTLKAYRYQTTSIQAQQ